MHLLFKTLPLKDYILQFELRISITGHYSIKSPKPDPLRLQKKTAGTEETAGSFKIFTGHCKFI